jgi:charged multivesicular body protein 7
LSRDKRFIDYNGNVIRIRCPSDGLDITTEDVAAASIKELTANLRHQTDILNSRIDSLGQETRAALERKNRIAAQALLKSRKLAESSLAKRYATLNQLEDIAAKMEQASDQAQLVNVMETSAIALKFLNTRVGGTGRVDEVMDQIRVQMSEVDEVAAILAESTGEPVDESQIDDELEMLENEARGKAKLEPVQQEKTQEASNTEQIQAQLANLPLPPGPVISDSGGLDAEAIESRVASLSLDHS